MVTVGRPVARAQRAADGPVDAKKRKKKKKKKILKEI